MLFFAARFGYVQRFKPNGTTIKMPGKRLVVEIDCQSVKTMLDAGEDFVFIDCREQSEYDTAKIAGATLLPMSELQSRVAELDEHKNSKVVIHCHHGGRSLNVAMWLKGLGFENPLSMAGGIEQWALEIDPAVPRY